MFYAGAMVKDVGGLDGCGFRLNTELGVVGSRLLLGMLGPTGQDHNERLGRLPSVVRPTPSARNLKSTPKTRMILPAHPSWASPVEL